MHPTTLTPAPETAAAPLSEQACQALRRAIVRCEFEPDQRLRIDELSRRFGLSSSPLREALNRLVQQGLVRALDNRGFRVAPITAASMADLARARLLLETEALRDALVHGSEDWEAGVVAAFHGLSVVEKRLTGAALVLDDTWSARHRAFHLAVYAGCTSLRLRQMIESLFDEAERYRIFSARSRTTERGKSAEHRRILDAVLARDVEKATALVQQHIRATERNVIQILQSLARAASG